jgi:hypothetical protein
MLIEDFDDWTPYFLRGKIDFTIVEVENPEG